MKGNEKINTTAQSGGVLSPDLLAEIELQNSEIARLNSEIKNKNSEQTALNSELAQLNSDIDNKKIELVSITNKVSEYVTDIELHKAQLTKLSEDIKALETLKPAPEKNILDDVDDVKIVYKSFSLHGKKYDREELAAALNQGDESALAVVRELATMKSGAIELIKNKE